MGNQQHRVQAALSSRRQVLSHEQESLIYIYNSSLLSIMMKFEGRIAQFSCSLLISSIVHLFVRDFSTSSPLILPSYHLDPTGFSSLTRSPGSKIDGSSRPRNFQCTENY